MTNNDRLNEEVKHIADLMGVLFRKTYDAVDRQEMRYLYLRGHRKGAGMTAEQQADWLNEPSHTPDCIDQAIDQMAKDVSPDHKPVKCSLCPNIIPPVDASYGKTECRDCDDKARQFIVGPISWLNL